MKQAIAITKSEIKWHEENRGEGPSKIHEEAFIKGLKHLLYLFQEAQSPEQSVEAGSYKACTNCGGVIGLFTCNCDSDVPPERAA